MPQYLHPGVYVEEVPGGARPISAVATSVTVFIGHAAGQADSPSAPALVTSFHAFLQYFGDGGSEASHLEHAVRGFFLNGGNRAYVLRVAPEVASIIPTHLQMIAALSDVSLVAAPGFSDPVSHTSLIRHCEARGDRMAVLDGPQEVADVSFYARTPDQGGIRPPDSASGLAAFYAPWLRVRGRGRGVVACPPSGHVCGAYAVNDAMRGVWKAPANIGLRGVLGLARNFDRNDQATLNAAGVNTILEFPMGIRIWGARTLAGSGNDYRYVPVRRLATMIRSSLSRGLRWTVFEPNDAALWQAVRRDVSGFLDGLFRSGALSGAKAEDAYFVRCGPDTTSQADIDNGRLIVLVGIAPIRPAEFVVMRIVIDRGT